MTRTSSDVCKFSLVVASSLNGAIGRSGQLPWHLKGDLKYFQELTTKSQSKMNAVIMGRKSWESIPEKYQPLDKRFNVILTSQQGYKTANMASNCQVCSSLDQALQELDKRTDIDKYFVVGGSGVYKEAMKHDRVEYIYLTRVNQVYEDCDAFFDVDQEWKLLPEQQQDQLLADFLPRQREDKGVKYEFQVFSKSQ